MSASPAGQKELSKAFERMIDVSGAKQAGSRPFWRHVQAQPDNFQQLEAEFGSGEERFALYGGIIRYAREKDDPVVTEEWLRLQRFSTGLVAVYYLSPRPSSYLWEELAQLSDTPGIRESLQQTGANLMREQVYGLPTCEVDVITLEKNIDNFVTAFSS